MRFVASDYLRLHSCPGWVQRSVEGMRFDLVSFLVLGKENWSDSKMFPVLSMNCWDMYFDTVGEGIYLEAHFGCQDSCQHCMGCRSKPQDTRSLGENSGMVVKRSFHT
jgi:hypothetical protein